MAAPIDMAALFALPADERAALAEALRQSVEQESADGGLTDAQRTELQRRLDLYRANPDVLVPWEEIKARSLARAKK